ncbi:VWA domain-containing protein [Nocardiopsis sp. NPDC050513]|uniref:VWA domain-containing protein n=1 Tax=Nocardiopsis sp. NPDC050513 TaxID=3364338 RepID=UPI0037AFC5EC
MHLSALLDFDVVPLDTDDAVSVLLDVTAPEREADTERPPATLQVVLDRSGSMGGGRLRGAVEALLALVDRLAPTDNFGLVAFDTQATVEVAAAPLTDRAEVRRRIAALTAHGGTDLSSGLLRGVQEARRASGGRGATLLLVSDGHANQGVTDHDLLRQVAADAYGHGVSTTTLGYGLGYDEALLGAIADGGAGGALFAEDPDTAGGLIAQEADYLLAKSAQAVSLRVPSGPHVRGVEVLGEVPSSTLPDGSLMVELGDLYSGESRRLLLRVEVPGVSELGTVAVTTLEAVYVDPATLTTYTVTLPITVNVVPGDEAAGRTPAPEVRTEEALQRAQTAKRRAGEALRRGNRSEAADILDEARRNLPAPPPGSAAHADPQVNEQADELARMARRARRDNASRTSKSLYASQSGYARRRRSQGGEQIRGQETGRDQSFPDQGTPGDARE